jgi:hypothetical protein
MGAASISTHKHERHRFIMFSGHLGGLVTTDSAATRLPAIDMQFTGLGRVN